MPSVNVLLPKALTPPYTTVKSSLNEAECVKGSYRGGDLFFTGNRS